MGTGASQSGDRVLDFHPVIGERWEITQSTAHTSDELVEATVWLDAGEQGPPPHLHPHSDETMEVLEGAMDVFKGGVWATLRPGERVSVPAGTRHTFRNDSGDTVKFVAQLRAAGRSEEFFRHMVALIHEGKIRGLPPKEPRSAIYSAMVFVSYPDVSRVTGPLGDVMKAMALIGRALRFKL